MLPHARVTVAVMHEDAVVDAGLRALLRVEPDVMLVDPSEGRCDVVVTDYQRALALLARHGASPAERAARDGMARPRVLVITTLEREWEVRRALDAGVHGYLMLDCAAGELLAGVRALARGSRYLCHAAMQGVADSLTRHALTGRESDVLQLLAHGLCNKRVGRELGIAVGTVKAHVKSILNKLNAQTRTQAVVVASERGLIAREGARPAPRPLATVAAFAPLVALPASRAAGQPAEAPNHDVIAA